MSGGSFNYLCYRDAGDLLSGGHDEDLVSMITFLKGHGCKDVATSSQLLLDDIRDARLKILDGLEKLNDVWHSVEWYMSGDSGKDEVQEAVKRWRDAHGKVKTLSSHR